MADIRINALATTATTPASDDYLALDGTAQGTRKILATNIANNVTDVILGTSGPSVKSTLSARAPRQGLVFDGTAKIPFSLAAFGTNPATIHFWFNPATLSGNPRLIGASSAIQLLIDASGAQFYTAGGSVYGSALTVGKTTAVTVVINGNGTAVVYTNGVAGTSGNITANLSTAIDTLGGLSSGNIFSGVMSPLIYNRALSASEVVALYEAGAPAGADYKQAYGTAKVTANGAPQDGTTFSSGTFTVPNSGIISFSAIYPAFPGIGVRLRVKFDYTTTTSGNLRLGGFGYNPSINGNGDNLAFSGSGTYTYEAVANATGAGWSANGFEFRSTGWTGTITNITITPLGLLLAPDAAQAGGGLVWYDTSGNAANITLPASGVSWNVPSSRVLGGNWNATGTFGIGTTSTLGTLNVATPNLTYGTVYLNGATTTADFMRLKSTGADGVFGIESSGGGTILTGSTANSTVLYSVGATALHLGTSGTTRATLTSGGNFLIGTTIDGGQKLQVSGTASITGEVAIGTLSPGNNTAAHFLTGYAANQSWPARISAIYDANFVDTYVTLNGTLTGTRATPTFTGATTGGAYLRFNGGTSEFVLGTYVGGAGAAAVPTLTLKTGDATFAGRITGTGIFGSALNANSTPVLYGSSGGTVMSYSGSGVGVIRPYANASGTGTSSLQISPGGTLAATFDSSANTTFVGSIAIGNTVQTAAAVASTHKVTISIGGTTYYLLATNV